MRFKVEKELEPSKEWNLWFAWYPVTIGDEYVWLEYVERKERNVMSDNNLFEPIYYYRNVKNLIQL